MNVFLVSYNQRQCALALDDLRLNKMVLEVAQMLCTVINLESGKKVTQYKNSHTGNKFIHWLREDPHNWSWLWVLGNEYGKEIIHRTGRKHASHLVLEGLTFNWPWLCQPGNRPTRFVNAARHEKLGLDFTHLPVRQAYREYLAARWDIASRDPKWTKREAPSWYC